MRKISENVIDDLLEQRALIKKTAQKYLGMYHQDWVDDVTQDVFLKVMDRGNTFNEQRGNVQGWIYTMTKNHCFDLMNKKDNVSKASIEESHFSCGFTSSSLERKSRRKYVRRSMGYLSPLDRQLITLKYHFDMSGREIASILKLPENQIASRLSRAKNRLRLLLESGKLGPF